MSNEQIWLFIDWCNVGPLKKYLSQFSLVVKVTERCFWCDPFLLWDNIFARRVFLTSERTYIHYTWWKLERINRFYLKLQKSYSFHMWPNKILPQTNWKFVICIKKISFEKLTTYRGTCISKKYYTNHKNIEIVCGKPKNFPTAWTILICCKLSAGFMWGNPDIELAIFHVIIIIVLDPRCRCFWYCADFSQ